MKAELESIVSDIRKSIDLLEQRVGGNAVLLRLEELNVLCEDSNIWSDLEKAKGLMQERQSLTENINSFNKLRLELADSIELFEMASLENDSALQDETVQNLRELKKQAELKET